MSKKSLSVILMICLLSGVSINSYGAKKKNIPDLRPVPGVVVNNREVVINPVPVSIEKPYNGYLNISAGINLDGVPDSYEDDFKGFKISNDGIPVKIINDRNCNLAEDKRGAYRLSIGPDKITISSADEDGIFYGIQTLRQVFESSTKARIDIPMMEINDYPLLKYRGVVEGFYGRPWSHETRMSILDFMGRNKMNSYVYGPKDDPYHRTPSWRQPYPEGEAEKIRQLAERARKNHIDFVWAIHPGGDIRWNKEDYDSLLNKFSSMYDLGVRQFAIFFDDIKGEGTDSKKQAQLLNGIVKDFVKKKDGVKNLIVCPTDYNQGWANASEEGQLSVYGRELDPEVEVFWTGKVVCGDIERESMDFVDSRIKRPALVWWNFPVSDYCKHNLLMGPVYGLDTTLDSTNMSGMETNPMENGEASKSAIYGVADYAWNATAYNPIDNWTRSFSEVMPGAPDEYGTFAIHSCDPPKNYRRNESWNVDTFHYNNYTQDQFESLKKEFQKIIAVEDKMVNEGGNVPLIVEIAPWLVEFTNLGERGLMALDLIKIYESGDKERFNQAYDRLETINYIQKPGYMDNRSGTLKLQPFIDNVLNDLRPARINN